MKRISFVEYLALAWSRKLYFKRSWRIAVLMRLLEYREDIDLYPYPGKSLYQFTLDGEDYEIEGTDVKKSVAKWDTAVKLPKGFIPNLSKDTESTFGLLLLNTIGFSDEFGDLIPYHNSEFTTGTFHKAYYKLYKEGKIANSKQLTNSTSRLHMLEADAELGVPAASIETFTTHPDMKKVVKEQIEANKDDLNNPATHAKMDAVTTTLDREYVKGTQAEKFLISGKMHDVVRKKTKIMYGSETDLDGKPTDLITRPLEDGVDLSQMPSWVNAARAGSYSRGALTALGGYSVKSDERAYGHLEVMLDTDCKTKKGLTIHVRNDNFEMFEGMRLLSNKEPLTLEYLQKNVGKSLVIRAPSHCALEKDYCEFCMGTTVGKAKLGIPGGVSLLDSKSMDAMMQAAHGKAVKVNTLSIQTSMT